MKIVVDVPDNLVASMESTWDDVEQVISYCRCHGGLELAKAIVLYNIDRGEFGFAADLVRELETL